MADGERRMLFDIRGRRKHVVRVVYAILAAADGRQPLPRRRPGQHRLAARHRRRSRPQRRDLRRTDRTDRTAPAQGPGQRGHPALADPGPHQRRPREERTRPDHRRNEGDRAGADRVRKGGRHLGPIPEGGRATNRIPPSPAWSPAPRSLSPRTRKPTRKRSNTWEMQPTPSGSRPKAAPASDPGRPWPPTRTSPATRPPARRPARKRTALTELEVGKESGHKQLAAFQKQAKEIQKAKVEAEKAEKGKGKEALENPLGGLGGGSPTTITP